jgi:hypothetical protein
VSAPEYTIVAFYTPEYERVLSPFLAMAEPFGLPIATRRMNSQGKWDVNTGLKPLALQYLRAEVKGPLLYLDIDTTILRLPALPPGTWDVAVAPNPIFNHICRINASSFFLADTVGARNFLLRWRQWVRENSRRDHPGLMYALETPPPDLLKAVADFAGCFAINGLLKERTQALT